MSKSETEWMGTHKPPIPPDESERLEALSKYESLDAEPPKEENFDNLAELAAEFCGVPISFVNLITKDKQIPKACYGFDADSMPRTDSFCQYTIMQDEIFEVKDTWVDDLMKNNPNVHGEMKIRYYAGFPLTTPDGYNIGSLCLIDNKPNELTDAQRKALRTISNEIVSRYELNLVRKQLEKRNVEKDELIRIVSHDMRNPLTGILGFSEMLISETGDEEHKEMLQSIQSAGEAMLNIVNVLLDSEYIRNQAFILDNSETDVSKVTQEVVDLHKPFTMMKNQNLSVQIEESLQCKIDREKWKQIVGNLLSNAIKFTPVEGDISLTLQKLDLEKPFIELVVKDSGIGIPEDEKRDLFTGKDSIRRSGTSGEKSTGLGMYIIKKFVNLMGGMLDVQTKVDQGTEFNLKIPIKK